MSMAIGTCSVLVHQLKISRIDCNWLPARRVIVVMLALFVPGVIIPATDLFD